MCLKKSNFHVTGIRSFPFLFPLSPCPVKYVNSHILICGLKTLQQRPWYRKLWCFYKILKSQSPKYLYSIIPIHNMSYRTRQCNKIPAINVKHDFFKNTYFPSTIMEWNKLDWEIKNSESIVTFKKRILSFIRPSANSTFNCHNPRGIKLLSRLRLGLSHLREHKFKHSFQDSLNPFCSCGKGEVETSSHYLLHCSNYSEERLALLNTIKNIDMSILQQSDSKLTSVLLFGNTSYGNNKNTFILDATIDYIISTGRFDVPLFNSS